MRLRHSLALFAAGGALLLTAAAVTATRRSAVEERLRGMLAGRLAAPCTFDQARFGFLDGLRVEGLRVFDPDDAFGPPLVAVDEAQIDFHVGLLGEGPHITSVTLLRPSVRFRLGADGTSALSRLVRPSPRAADPDAPTLPLPTVRIVDGTLTVSGAPLLEPGAAFDLSGIQATLSADGDTVRVEHARATSGFTGQIDVQATSREAGRVLDIEVRLQDLDIAQLRAIRPAAAARDVLERHDVVGRVTVDGSFRIEDGRVADAGGTAEVRAATLLVAIPDEPGLRPPTPFRVRVDAATASLSAGTVTLDSLAGEVLGAPVAVEGVIELDGIPGAPPERTPSIQLNAYLQGVRVGPEMDQHLHADLRSVIAAFALAGTTDVRLDVSGETASPRIDAHLDLREFRASYVGYVDPDTGRRRGVPWLVTDLVGTLDVALHRVSFAATGRHGVSNVTLRGVTDRHESGFPFTDVHVTAEDVAIADLRTALGDRDEALLGRWRPEGTAGRVEVRAEQDPVIDRGSTSTQVEVAFDGRASLRPDHLPVPLRRARGTIRVLEPIVDDRRISRVEIEGLQASGDDFDIEAVDGSVVDDPVAGNSESVDVRIAARELGGALAEGLAGSSGIPQSVKRALSLLAPRGAGSFHVALRDEFGARDDRVTMDLLGASILGWEGVPLGAENVRGRVDYARDTITTPGLDFTLLGSAAHVNGEFADMSAPTPRVTLDITATALPLDRRLRVALGVVADDAAGVWDELDPGPALAADVSARVRPDGSGEAAFAFELTGLRGLLHVLGVPLDLETGTARFDGSSASGAAEARAGSGQISISAFGYDTETGDASARLSARGLRFPDDLVPLIPAQTATALHESIRPSLVHVDDVVLAWDAEARRLALTGGLAVRPAARDVDASGIPVDVALVLDRFVMETDSGDATRASGLATIQDAALDPGVGIAGLTGELGFEIVADDDATTLTAQLAGASARVLGFPLEDLTLRIDADGDRLAIEDIAATLFGGQVTGRFRKGAGERLAYRGAFEVSGADLAAAAADAGKDPAAGSIDLSLRFRNPSGEPDDLVGSGSAELSGASVRVPFLTAALEAVDGALLGAAAIEGGFQSGRADFDLRGRHVHVRNLQADGPGVPLLFDAALELRDGEGAIDLGGDRLDLIVYPRLRFRMLDIDPTGVIDRVFGLAQFLLRRLRIEGTLRNPRTSWEVVPRDIEQEFAPRPLPVGSVRRYGPEPW